MSNAIKINKKKGDKKPKSAQISQSIPAHFYKNYVPPKTPTIKPMAPPNIPDFTGLPQISPSSKGININKSGSYSLKQNKHPMSMPVRQGIMGPKTPFDIMQPKKQSDAKQDDKEQKDEPNSLEQEAKRLKVGSFTCFDVMNSPLQQLPEAPDNKDNASATSASTFASKQNNEEEAPEDDAGDDDELEVGEMEF